MLCKKRAAVFCTRAEENRERYKSCVHHSGIFASGFAQPSAAGATATSACEYSHWVHRIAGNGAEQYVGPRHVIAELLYDDRKCEHCQKHKQAEQSGQNRNGKRESDAGRHAEQKPHRIMFGTFQTERKQPFGRKKTAHKKQAIPKQLTDFIHQTQAPPIPKYLFSCVMKSLRFARLIISCSSPTMTKESRTAVTNLRFTK